MVRTALVIGLIASALLGLIGESSTAAQTSQSTQTICMPIGSIINCNSTTTSQQNTLPDFGAVAKSGADSVPKYRPPVHSPAPQPIEQSQENTSPLSSSGGLTYTDMEWVNFVVAECDEDWQFFNDKNKSRVDSPMFMGRSLEPHKRREYLLMCMAIVKSKPYNSVTK